MGDYTPLYLNELLYMDANIASILDELKSTGLLDKTVVVITADHGEMLGQDGGPTGHGWKLTPQLANVPLIIMDPGRTGYRINNHIGSQVDLLPTVLDVLGLPLPAGELYQGQSLQTTEQNPGRTIYLNSYADYAVITGNELRFGNRQNDAPPAAASLTPVYQIGNRVRHGVHRNQPTNSGVFHSTFRRIPGISAPQLRVLSRFPLSSGGSASPLHVPVSFNPESNFGIRTRRGL